MENDKYIFFCSHVPNKLGVHIFSQWFPCKFTDGKVNYLNAEQYMMSQKSLLFGDHEVYNLVMETDDPEIMKKLGRKIKGFDEKIWDEHKFKIVVDGNHLKFGQNPELFKKLKSTGNKIIVEAASYDIVWGIGLKAEVAVNIPEQDWPGLNLLGKALMKVRDS